MADEELKNAVDAELLKQATQAQSFTVDGMSKSNRSLRDLIDLDNHASKKAGHRFGFGMRQMIPPEH